MSGPKRIQRKRTKGWRMPEGAVYVGRPTRWGNDIKVGDCLDCGYGEHDGEHRPMDAATVVQQYRVVEEALEWAEGVIGSRTPEENRLCGVSGIRVDRYEDIRGKDLACWCPLDQPCHADVLLELANR